MKPKRYMILQTADGFSKRLPLKTVAPTQVLPVMLEGGRIVSRQFHFHHASKNDKTLTYVEREHWAGVGMACRCDPKAQRFADKNAVLREVLRTLG